MNAKKLLVAIAAALIGVPAAAAGTDTGIGIPTGRDAASPPVPLVTEHTGGIFRASQPVPFVSERPGSPCSEHGCLTGRALTPVSAFASENTGGQSRTPVRIRAAAVVAASDSGFNWNDAGIGAGVTLALLLIGSASALAIRRGGLPAH